MAKNNSLATAKKAKNDEYYTQWDAIQNEINSYIEVNPDVFRNKTILLPCDDPEWSNFTKFFAQKFTDFGLKKLISTSYAVESKVYKDGYQPTLFEQGSNLFDSHKTRIQGKIFTLDSDRNGDNKIDIDDLKWEYLNGDGDFNSQEVQALYHEADIIITNPPFSKFREFMRWLLQDENKKFIIIGNMNAITYRDIFPRLCNDQMWLGKGFHKGNAYFKQGAGLTDYKKGVYDEATGLVKFRNCCWFTNLENSRRQQMLSLMTMEDNIKYSKHKEVRNIGYKKYGNYDAIEIPFTDAIPGDYEGVMGVPASFLQQHCPEQYEIIWRGGDIEWATSKCDFFTPPTEAKSKEYKKLDRTWRVQNPYIIDDNGVPNTIYQRIFIKKRK